MENLEGGGYPSYAHIVKVSCEARVPVLKLHGSVSWSIRNGRLLKYHDCRPAIRGDAAIIAPVTNKAVPDIFQKIWEMAGEALSASSALLVIGYSLPEYDLAVRDLIKRKLPSRSAVHIFDPQPAIADRYKDLLPAHIVTAHPGLPDGIDDIACLLAHGR